MSRMSNELPCKIAESMQYADEKISCRCYYYLPIQWVVTNGDAEIEIVGAFEFGKVHAYKVSVIKI